MKSELLSPARRGYHDALSPLKGSRAFQPTQAELASLWLWVVAVSSAHGIHLLRQGPRLNWLLPLSTHLISRGVLVCYTTRMNAETTTIDMDLQEQADAEAVLRHAFEGQALDAGIARRVHERAARITDGIRRSHGVIDDDTFHDLLRDNDEL